MSSSNGATSRSTVPQVSELEAAAIMRQAIAAGARRPTPQTQEPAQDQDTEMAGEPQVLATPTLEALVARLNLKVAGGDTSLNPGSYLPSFKKGNLTEQIAADILNQFVTKAAILLDKIKMAEKILRETMTHTQVDYWGYIAINTNRVTLSKDSVQTLKKQFDDLLVQAIKTDKIALIAQCQKELDEGLCKGLSDALNVSSISIENNDHLGAAGKNYAYKIIAATATEFTAQVQALRMQAEFTQVKAGLKVFKHSVFYWLLPRIQNLYEILTKRSSSHPDPKDHQERLSPEEGERQTTTPLPSKQGTKQVQRTKRVNEGSEQKEECTFKAPGKEEYTQAEWKRQKVRQEQQAQEVAMLDEDVFSGVNNISSLLSIPHDILYVLNKGVNFNIQKQPRYDILNTELKKLKRGVYKQFKNDDFTKAQILFDAYKPKLFEELTQLRISNPHAPLLNKIKKTIKFMQMNKLIIGPADKNLGLTIMDLSWYLNHLRSIFDDKRNYFRLTNDKYDDRALNNMIEELRQDSKHFRFNFEGLDSAIIAIEKRHSNRHQEKGFVVPVMYLLPKIHKTPFGVRPIVPSFPWITHTISELIDRETRVILQDFSHDLPDTPTLIRALEKYPFDLQYDYFVFSYDVINMYGNIDFFEASDTIRNFFGNRDPRKDKIFMILRLALWVISNTYVSDGRDTYRQTTGLPMGTPMAPAIARLFACCVENGSHHKGTTANSIFLDVDDDLFDELDSLRNMEYTFDIFRYIDDGFTIFKIPRFEGTYSYHVEVAKELFDCFDISLHKLYGSCKSINITIDHGVHGREAVMLDLLVKIIDEGYNYRFDIAPYDKPMNKHLYTDPETYFPNKYIFNWINGENQRLIRNSSLQSHHQTAQDHFTKYLICRNYPERVIKEQLQLHSYEERGILLHPLENDQPSDIDSSIKETRIFLSNISGRAKLEQFGRNIVQSMYNTNKVKYENYKTTWVIYRGSNLRDELNRYNRQILGVNPTIE
jgi:hypothetical protein